MEELSTMDIEGMEEGILGDGLEPGETADSVSIDVMPVESNTEEESNMDVESDQTEGYVGEGVEDTPADAESTDESDSVLAEGDSTGEAEDLTGSIDMGELEGDGMGLEESFGVATPASSFAPMSSYPFVIGMGVLAIALGVLFGVLLAKRRIKKGIEAYED